MSYKHTERVNVQYVVGNAGGGSNTKSVHICSKKCMGARTWERRFGFRQQHRQFPRPTEILPTLTQGGMKYRGCVQKTGRFLPLHFIKKSGFN